MRVIIFDTETTDTDATAEVIEAADLINVGVDILLITAGDGPDAPLSVYPWLILNLMEKAAKYDRGENRIGGRD